MDAVSSCRSSWLKDHSTKTALSGLFQTKKTPPKGQNYLYQEFILDCWGKIIFIQYKICLFVEKYSYLIDMKTNARVQNKDTND